MSERRSHVAWDKVEPFVVAQCSARHIQSVLEDAKRDIALLDAALAEAETFIAGFEGDQTQDHIEELLAKVRAAQSPTGGFSWSRPADMAAFPAQQEGGE